MHQVRAMVTARVDAVPGIEDPAFYCVLVSRGSMLRMPRVLIGVVVHGKIVLLALKGEPRHGRRLEWEPGQQHQQHESADQLPHRRAVGFGVDGRIPEIGRAHV